MSSESSRKGLRHVVKRQEIDVPVDGGLMRVGVWGTRLPGAPVVLAVHGITASHVGWELLARQLPHAWVVAPDLRGRGRSGEPTSKRSGRPPTAQRRPRSPA
jgi:alpha-beta hydrolase superfamily lysophospholipase